MSTKRPHHFAHLLQIHKKSLWTLIFYIFFHAFIHVYSPGRGRQPNGAKILMSTGSPPHFGQLLQVSKKLSSTSDFIHIFSWFLNVYSCGSGEDNPQGTKFLCQQKPLATLVICYKFQKNISEVWFYTHFFFMILYMYTAPGQGQTTSWVQNLVIWYKFQNILFEIWFYTFFNDFIHVSSQGQGQTNFWCQQKGLITLPICCKFIKNPFELWFYTYFFMLLYMYIALAGADNPLGTKFWCQQKHLATSVVSCKFLPLNDFLTFPWNVCIFSIVAKLLSLFRHTDLCTIWGWFYAL